MRRKWKSILFAANVLLGISAFSGCNLKEMSSLQDVSRPYTGEYKCKRLQLGSEDMLQQYDFIKLNLGYNGSFRVTAKSGDTIDSYKGTYRISEEEESLTLTSVSEGEEQTYIFPYRKGKVCMELLFREKLLYAEFSAVE